MDWIMNAKVVFLATENRPEFSIRKISEVSIESSWKTICDTAELVLPRNVKDFDSKKVKDVFRRGDKVEIYLCYGMDEDLKLEFSGYITKVSAEYPIRITLEDEMWKLKQIPVNFSAKDVKLKDFIKKFVNDYPIDIELDENLGSVGFRKTTLGEVLRKFQDELSIYAFIRNGKFTITKPYSDITDDIPVFDLERDCVSNDLNYLSKEERTIKIIAESRRGIAKTRKKLKVEFGDENPVTIMNTSFNVDNIKDLQAKVRRLYDLYKKEGWDGSFTTFGFPFLQHGQKVKLTSSLYEDRSGIYYIDGLKKTFNIDGFRQVPELGPAFIR